MLCFEIKLGPGNMPEAARLLKEDERPQEPAIKKCGFKSLPEANKIATLAMHNEGTPALEAVDLGSAVSPRFWIVRKFQVGDPVSKTINGDHYSVGTITHISPTGYKIEVSGSGRNVETMAFYRRGRTATWLQNGVWHLEYGHHSELSQEF